MIKKKVCIFTISMNRGGAERVISLFLKHLVKDFDVTLVLLSNDIKYSIPEDVKIIAIGSPNTFSNTSSLAKLKIAFRSVFKYRKIIKKEKFDTVLSFLALPNMINNLVIKLLTNSKAKTILSERCYPSEMYAPSPFSMKMAKWFYPIFYNKSDALFSNSEYINDDLKLNFGVTAPLSVIYKGHKPYKDEYEQNSPFNIINVGNHSFPKDQELLLKAMTLLNNEYYLTILGEGDLTVSLNTYVANQHLEDRVNLAGRVTNVNSYLLQNNCFVLSSKTEGFPNVLLEAMAIGLPVISTHCMSGPLELLNDNEPITIAKGEFYLAKYGILINVGDHDALVKAITYYKNNDHKRKEFSDLAFKRAKDFNLPIIYKQLKELINE